MLDIAPLVENGNAVPITVNVDSPMTAADHVRAIAIFNERTRSATSRVFHARAARRPRAVATRIRLATSQQLVAVAQMSDGSVWSAHGRRDRHARRLHRRADVRMARAR